MESQIDGSAGIGEQNKNNELPSTNVEVRVNKKAIEDLMIEVSECNSENEFQREQNSKEIELLKRFGDLPESITVSSEKPVIIFGGNGSGKSTLGGVIGLTITAETDIAWEKKYGENPHFTNVSEWVDYQHSSNNVGQLIDLQRGFTADILKAGIFSLEKPIDDQTKVLFLNTQEVLGKEMHRAFSDYMDSNSLYELQFRDGKPTDLEQQGNSSRQYIDERINALIDGQPESDKTVLIIDEPDFALSPQRQEEFFKDLIDKCGKKGITLVMATNSGYLWDNKEKIESQAIEIKTNESRELEERFNKLLAKLPETAENVTSKSLEVEIDASEIDNLISEAESNRNIFGVTDENKKRELVNMLNNIKKLGEKVTFDKGVNLIFGENGSGKSTITKAIQVSMLANEYHQLPKQIVSGDGSMRYGYDIAAELVERNIIKIKAEKEEENFGFKSWDSVVMIDPLRGIGETASIYENAMKDSRWRREYMNDLKNGIGVSQKDSSRQTIEQEIVEKANKVAPGGVIIIDEAEGGLSPMDQERFHLLLNELGNRGYTVIVPTNSYYAYKNEAGAEKRIFLGGKK